jgi:hypothetical protein
MPVILATQEAEIRRTDIQIQSGQIVWETLSRKYLSQKGLVEWLKGKAWVQAPIPQKKRGRGRREGHGSRPAWEKVNKTLSQKQASSRKLVAHTCNLSYLGGRDQEFHSSWANHKKKADGVAQVVERLSSKCEALSSSPNTTKRKKKIRHDSTCL